MKLTDEAAVNQHR